jgi:amino acid transporter
MGQVVNVVMITAQLSSMNSALYIASRTLVALASNGRAPKIFARTTKNGTPVYALVLSNALGLISMLNYTAGPGKVFTYLINISGSATYITWACIGVVHLRFRRAWKVQGHAVEELPFKAKFYPYGTFAVIFVNTFLVFIAGYGWKTIKRTRLVPLAQVDLLTGRREGLL